MRPNFITTEDISRWDDNIENDPYLPKDFPVNSEQREVLYAGLWLSEQLIKYDASPEEITKLQYISGGISVFQDPWEVHLKTAALYRELGNKLFDLTIEDNKDLN